ncbi:GNAT family N-acetyltransferase [Shinella sp. CPCC 101442]|uniref:acyl-homoserine-lactone synthase n=1 Tax=Shinella sp. CPCC 101442 TaxID=2932265 RepID=UPI00215284B2|nr:GNAT family N-acetyltransferase [Shinella sp. CPCC 101442]MCR6502050.1 GNAT family N-acetyltransferase [Shinella sp. CPCC 101442]
MIEIVTMRHAAEMEEAYNLRHEVFVEEKGWGDLARPDRREIDQFDNADAVHMICKRDGKVVGYQRMLPTTKPHLLSTVLSTLCEVDRPIGPHIWEWTRYCVSKSHRERGRKLSPVANELLSGIVEWGLATGVDRIVIEMEPIWLLRLVQLNFMVTPLGIPRQIDEEDVVAVIAKFDRRTLEMLQLMRGNTDQVLVTPDRVTQTGRDHLWEAHHA